MLVDCGLRVDHFCCKPNAAGDRDAKIHFELQKINWCFLEIYITSSNKNFCISEFRVSAHMGLQHRSTLEIEAYLPVSPFPDLIERVRPVD